MEDYIIQAIKLGYNATSLCDDLEMLIEFIRILDEFYIDIEYQEVEIVVPSI